MLWRKPNGTELEINDEPGNVAQCKEMGWKVVKENNPNPKPGPSASGTVTLENKKE